MQLTSERKIIILLVVISLIIAGSAVYFYLNLNEKIAVLENELNSTNTTLASTNAILDDEKITNNDLSQALDIEQEKNRIAQMQIESLSGTVGTFEKLNSLDAELLEKYSKVFFLSENYIPSLLLKIQPQYTMDENKEYLIEAHVAPFLQVMLTVAKNSEAEMEVASAYRSFNDQTHLKGNYKFIYGSGANQFSADQGYSEHQLGTAVDLTTPSLNNGLSVAFADSAAGKWMNDNAYKYGFTLSYPKNNSYYQFEPWHWRFVGRALATYLHDANIHFYDMDQREIDKYLISIFD